jgi:hypothetical protein
MRLIRIRSLERNFPFKIYSRIFPLNDLKYIEYNLLNDKLTFKFDKEVVSTKSNYYEYLQMMDKLNKKEGDIEI